MVCRRALYFPIAGQARWQHKTQRARLLKLLGGNEVRHIPTRAAAAARSLPACTLRSARPSQLVLRTEDDRNVHCVWIEHSPERARNPRAPPSTAPSEADTPIDTPVVLLMHANAMVLDDMVDWAQFYGSLGCSVMLLTFWGFPDPNEHEPNEHDDPSASASAESSSLLGQTPPGERSPSERGMYLDAEAALRYVQQVRRCPIERTLAHGLSIGGACAASLGVQHPGLRVTFDQSFASLAEVSLHVGRGLYDQVLVSRAPRSLHSVVRCLQPVLLRMAVFVLLRMVFKTGKGGPALCAQDRMDNVRKAAAIKGDVFAIFAEHDEMMHPDIARRILLARYGRKASAELLRSRMLCVPGGHCCFFGDVPELAHKYASYLHTSGFLTP